MQQIVLERLEKLDYRSNEAYKSLRTNIQFCGSDVKLICITSCLPDEGKSSISFHLASSLAESGKRVIYVDADLRRSATIGRYKPDQAVNGLTHYLSGMCTLEEILYETNEINLDMVFTGPVPPNPSELLGSDLFIQLIRMLRENYDYVIVDTPPLGNVIDSAIIAKYCDGVILVIEANAISYKLAQKVKKQLDKGNCRILGAVLNKVAQNDSNYRYYGKKYKKYSNKYYSMY
ncbi:MAG: CpsD/CapB family tyrosine-protein kinase [Clostridiales bacterium]|nr:CpsD/CapB family tyrosine-protein kinase [Clostridiales bacterium]